MADDDDDLPDIERATGEEGPASGELPTGEIAHAWREEFDEELTATAPAPTPNSRWGMIATIRAAC